MPATDRHTSKNILIPGLTIDSCFENAVNSLMRHTGVKDHSALFTDSFKEYKRSLENREIIISGKKGRQLRISVPRSAEEFTKLFRENGISCVLSQYDSRTYSSEREFTLYFSEREYRDIVSLGRNINAPTIADVLRQSIWFKEFLLYHEERPHIPRGYLQHIVKRLLP
ncbi:MAG TPA: hypothetical protein VJI75_02290 [Candidatus Nanoarchaeia archaeon]|nr:hypothetical protein [Candidatus Nanoarchaeia archaeon]